MARPVAFYSGTFLFFTKIYTCTPIMTYPVIYLAIYWEFETSLPYIKLNIQSLLILAWADSNGNTTFYGIQVSHSTFQGLPMLEVKS